jgi:hypothetical protein
MVVEEAGASIQAAEAGPAEDPIRLLQPGTEVRLLSVRAAGLRPGQVTVIPGPAAMSRAGTSGMEIPIQRPPLSRMAGGIPSPARVEAAERRERNRQLDLQAMREGSTFLAEIARRDPRGQSAVFRGRAAKSGRILRPRKMLFPGLNLSPHFTIRLAVQPPQVQGCGRTRRSLHLHASPGDRRSLATEDFPVA